MEPSLIIDHQYLFLTNAHQKKIFPINSPQPTTTTSTTSLNSPFKCLLTSSNMEEGDSEDIFEVTSSYVNGQPSCVILTKDLNDIEKKRISVTNDRLLDLSVVLTDRVSRTEWKSQRNTQLRFTADIFVTKGELLLTKDQPFRTIDLFGSNSQLTSLKVLSNPHKSFFLPSLEFEMAPFFLSFLKKTKINSLIVSLYSFQGYQHKRSWSDEDCHRGKLTSSFPNRRFVHPFQ